MFDFLVARFVLSSFVFGVIIIIIFVVLTKSPRKLGDHTYLTWNTEQESSAVASGRDQRFGEHAP